MPIKKYVTKNKVLEVKKLLKDEPDWTHAEVGEISEMSRQTVTKINKGYYDAKYKLGVGYTPPSETPEAQAKRSAKRRTKQLTTGVEDCARGECLHIRRSVKPTNGTHMANVKALQATVNEVKAYVDQLAKSVLLTSNLPAFITRLRNVEGQLQVVTRQRDELLADAAADSMIVHATGSRRET